MNRQTIRCIILFLLGLSPIFKADKVLAQDTLSIHYLQVHPFHKDTLPASWKWISNFTDKNATEQYIYGIPTQLQILGYPLASVDSVWVKDSVMHAMVYAGKQYELLTLTPVDIDDKALIEIGFKEKQWKNKSLSAPRLLQMQNKLLTYYANNGYPFAQVYLDSIVMNNETMSAQLKVNKSLLYPIDSIRVQGKANIHPAFLQRYLDIPNGSPYNQAKIEQVDKKLNELPFFALVQPTDVTMLGSGAVLNVYVNNKRSSQTSFLIGVLPDSKREGKLMITGDVMLDLKNLLGRGENILLKWQQLQRNSPRLNLGFRMPYVLQSRFGIDLSFNLYKKDANYLQINGQAGLVYISSAAKTGKLIMQWQKTGLLVGAVDTLKVIQQRKLPDIMDVSAVNVGIQYDFSKTDYKFNPRKGWEGGMQTTIGIKKVLPNSDILSIKDPTFDYNALYDSVKGKSYQLRAQLHAAHYFSIGKQTTLKWGIHSGLYLSKHIFRNDIFQIGGFNLMRGFDEESIFTDRFLVNSIEFRLLTGMNSYLFLFSDAGWTANKVVNVNNQFISGGLGLVLETKLGLVNVSYAVGKRNDVPFSLREGSKLHFGYSNFF